MRINSPRSLCLGVCLGLFMTLSAVRADNTSTPTPADQKQAKKEKIEQFLQQLNLTEAQKAQIKQIRETVTDKKERRQQTLAVLTPEQKAQIKQLLAQRKAQAAG